MKSCFKCDQVKPLSEFYRHPRMADGHLNKCKACAKRDSTQHRNDNLERVRSYDRRRGARQPPEYLAAYRHNHPDRQRVNSAVARAVRLGRLIRPDACWYCGSTRQVVGHHADYSRPLAVSWLCQACHVQAHIETEQLLQQSLS